MNIEPKWKTRFDIMKTTIRLLTLIAVALLWAAPASSLGQNLYVINIVNEGNAVSPWM